MGINNFGEVDRKKIYQLNLRKTKKRAMIWVNNREVIKEKERGKFKKWMMMLLLNKVQPEHGLFPPGLALVGKCR